MSTLFTVKITTALCIMTFMKIHLNHKTWSRSSVLIISFTHSWIWYCFTITQLVWFIYIEHVEHAWKVWIYDDRLWWQATLFTWFLYLHVVPVSSCGTGIFTWYRYLHMCQYYIFSECILCLSSHMINVSKQFLSF